MSIETQTISFPNGWESAGIIGRGSSGTVYKAKRTTGRNTEWAAIKHISVPASSDELDMIRSELGTTDQPTISTFLQESLQDMLEEYYQIKRLQGHTNIVACHDFQQIPKTNELGYDVYIWMELLESLSSKIVKGEMDRAETIRMGMDICKALGLLKSERIIHRDIKPQNIFVNDHGDYKLGDFGSARRIMGTSDILTMKGTFSFMAPEIMQGRPADYTSDIYSLGLVMYRLMNRNRHPFAQEGDFSSVRGIESLNYRRLSGEALSMPLDADEELGRIILKACAFEPRNRWRTSEEMYNALAELGEGAIKKTTEVSPDNNKEIDLSETESEPKSFEAEAASDTDQVSSDSIFRAGSVMSFDNKEIDEADLAEKEIEDGIKINETETGGTEILEKEIEDGTKINETDIGETEPTEEKTHGKTTNIDAFPESVLWSAGDSDGKKTRTWEDTAKLGIGLFLCLLLVFILSIYNGTLQAESLKQNSIQYHEQTSQKVGSYSPFESFVSGNTLSDSDNDDELSDSTQTIVQKAEFPLKKNGQTVSSANALSLYDIVTIGKYPQESNGVEKPIRWYVIKKNGNKVTLLSVDVLDCQKFHDQNREITFINSDLYHWLNNEFLTRAFRVEERKMIQAKVSLLNKEEAESLEPRYLTASCTDYAVMRGYNDSKMAWWLGEFAGGFNVGDDQMIYCAYCVSNSEINRIRVDFNGKGVRPVIIVQF